MNIKYPSPSQTGTKYYFHDTLLCPSDTDKQVSWDWIPIGISYGMNAYIYACPNKSKQGGKVVYIKKNPNDYAKKSSQIKRPTQVNYIADNWVCETEGSEKTGKSPKNIPSRDPGRASVRGYGAHGERRNSLFYDGLIGDENTVKVISQSDQNRESIWNAKNDSDILEM